MTAALLLTLLAAAPCPLRVVDAVDAVPRSACAEQELQAGDAVVLSPGGLVEVRGEGAAEICANLGPFPVTLLVDEELRLGVVEACVQGETDDAPCPPASRVVCRPPAEDAGEGTRERIPVFVFDFEGIDVDPATSALLNGLVTAEISRRRELDVYSGEEVRRLLRSAGEKERAGCSEDSESCLVEVAGALGARYVVAGKVARVGRLLAVSLSLLDSEGTAVLSRVRIEERDVVRLQGALRAGVHNLLGPITGEPPVVVPPPPTLRAMEDPSSVGGAAIAASVVAGTACCCIAGPGLALAALFASYAGAQGALVGALVALILTLAPVPCAVVGGAAGGELGDRLLGEESHWARSATAAAVATVGAGATVAAGGAGAVIGYGVSVIAGLPSGSPSEVALVVAGAGVALALGVAATAVATGLAFDFTVPLFERSEPGPSPVDDEVPSPPPGVQARGLAY